MRENQVISPICGFLIVNDCAYSIFLSDAEVDEHQKDKSSGVFQFHECVFSIILQFFLRRNHVQI